VNSPKTCNSLSQKEFIDKGNTSAGIITGAVAAPIAVLAAPEIAAGATSLATSVSTLATSVAASASALGGTVAGYLATHPGLISGFDKAGKVADITELIAGSISCAIDSSSGFCKNLQDDWTLSDQAGISGTLSGLVNFGESIVAARIIKSVGGASVDAVNTIETITDVLSEVPVVENAFNGVTDVFIKGYPFSEAVAETFSPEENDLVFEGL
jgi:hypothetical protein